MKTRIEKVRAAAGFAVKAILVLTMAVVLAGYVEIHHVLHPARVIPEGKTLRKFHIEYHDVTLVTEDGIRLAAWYTPPRNGAVILLAHGFGDKRPEWVYEMLARTGYGVLAWDARAHGQSGGDFSTIGYLEVMDVKAALDFALAQPGVRHIGAWGGSMGGATLILATARYPQIEALFVDSPFTSLNDEVDYLIPYPVINPLAKFLAKVETGVDVNQVSPVSEIAKISPRPIYIVLSTADKVAPPNAGETLFNAARDPRFLWLDHVAPHQQVFLENPSRYKKRLIGFFDEWLLRR